MTNGSRQFNYDNKMWWEEAADILTCLYKPLVDSADPIMKDLDGAAAILREGPTAGPDPKTPAPKRWQCAERNCRRAADLVECLRRRSRSIHGLDGLLPMYQGALEHARGNFASAIAYYKDAEQLLRDHRHNWAVAILAQALVFLQQDIEDQVPEVGDALQALRVSEFGRTATERWQAAQEAYKQRTTAHSPAKEASAGGPSSSPTVTSSESAPENPPSHHMPPSMTISNSRIRILAAIAAAAAVIGFVVVIGVGRTLLGLVAYLGTFLVAVLAYLLAIAFERPLEIPDMCAALIKGPAGPTIRPGPESYRGWPLIQKARAIVPLSAQNFVSSRQKVNIKSSLTVEISLAVRYRVCYYDVDSNAQRSNINRAVDGVLDLLPKLNASHNGPWQPGDLRAAWQRKLLDDIRMTLYQCLPNLITSNQLDQSRAMITQQLTRSLRDKTKEWGIEILEVYVAELNEAK
jgi:tetratricopeptide (TPR) repeat protein